MHRSPKRNVSNGGLWLNWNIRVCMGIRNLTFIWLKSTFIWVKSNKCQTPDLHTNSYISIQPQSSITHITLGWPVGSLATSYWQMVRKFLEILVESGKKVLPFSRKIHRNDPYHLISPRNNWFFQRNGKRSGIQLFAIVISKWMLPELSFSDRWSRGTKLWERDCRCLGKEPMLLHRTHFSIPSLCSWQDFASAFVLVEKPWIRVAKPG